MGHGYSDDKCVICGKHLTYGHKTNYCYTHMREKQNQDKIDLWLKTGNTSCAVGTTLRNGIRKYILECQNYKCAICGMNNEWNNMPITFVLDHIDGNAANGARQNLRLICPNCDSQLSTYKSKNKKSARSGRKDFRLKRIKQIDIKTGNTVQIYDSIAQASRKLNCTSSIISECVNGRTSEAAGYRWEYI